jgi:TorA maturation chaperone TorD
LDIATPTDLLPSFRRLFVDDTREQVSLYETEYGSRSVFDKARELANLARFYRAFDLALKQSDNQRADHISAECEFVCLMTLREARALQRSSPIAEETRAATRLFLREHLSRFVPAVAAKLVSADDGGFYGALARLCSKFVAWDCSWLGIEAGSANLSAGPAENRRLPNPNSQKLLLRG